jgi:hypothetical protein
MALAEIDMKIAVARTKEERVYLRKEREIISRYLNQKMSRYTSSHGDDMSIVDNNRSISPK